MEWARDARDGVKRGRDAQLKVGHAIGRASRKEVGAQANDGDGESSSGSLLSVSLVLLLLLVLGDLCHISGDAQRGGMNHIWEVQYEVANNEAANRT
jgi:hypothetical protein